MKSPGNWFSRLKRILHRLTEPTANVVLKCLTLAWCIAVHVAWRQLLQSLESLDQQIDVGFCVSRPSHCRGLPFQCRRLKIGFDQWRPQSQRGTLGAEYPQDEKKHGPRTNGEVGGSRLPRCYGRLVNQCLASAHQIIQVREFVFCELSEKRRGWQREWRLWLGNPVVCGTRCPAFKCHHTELPEESPDFAEIERAVRTIGICLGAGRHWPLQEPHATVEANPNAIEGQFRWRSIREAAAELVEDVS